MSKIETGIDCYAIYWVLTTVTSFHVIHDQPKLPRRQPEIHAYHTTLFYHGMYIDEGEFSA